MVGEEDQLFSWALLCVILGRVWVVFAYIRLLALLV